MRYLLTTVLLVGIVACATSTANAIIVIGGSTNNGWFDIAVPVQNTTGSNPQSFIPQPAGWTYQGNAAIVGNWIDGLTLEPWAGPAPTPVTDGNVGAPPRPEGCGNGPECGVFFKAFQGNTTRGPLDVDLFQDNPATPGRKYVLTGWAGAEANFTASGAELALEFLDGGGSVIPLSGQVIDLMPTLKTPNGESFNYKQYKASAFAPAGAVEVRVRTSMIDGIPSPTGGGQAFVIDDFELRNVPEPASAALCLIGLLGMTGLARRR